MPRVRKISVSIGQEEAKWAERRAKKLGASLSSVLTDALRRAKQQEAGESFLQQHADKVPNEATIAKLERECLG